MTTTTVDQPRSFHSEDVPYALPNDAPEWKRLDDMHEGMDAYLGHRLSYAPLAENTKQILEIGCGSGAWAIQAAQTYADATITAIDISPPPPRPLPKNVKFQKLDVTETLPFEPASFDIVHARFILIHLPNWEAVLQQAISLLKPGGWLLVEDSDHVFFDEKGDIGPCIQRFYNVYHAYMRSQNIDYTVGSKLEATLNNTLQFSEVNAIQIKCCVNGNSKDPRTRDIGLRFGASFRAAYQVLSPKLVAAGISPELHQGLFDEFNDPARSIYNSIYMTWSRKNEGTT